MSQQMKYASICDGVAEEDVVEVRAKIPRNRLAGLDRSAQLFKMTVDELLQEIMEAPFLTHEELTSPERQAACLLRSRMLLFDKFFHVMPPEKIDQYMELMESQLAENERERAT